MTRFTIAATVVSLLSSATFAGQPRDVGGQNAPTSLIELPPDVPADALRYTVLMMGNKAGVNVVWRTPDGASQAGIPAAQVLADATLGAARIVKVDDALGSIAEGKLADLVLIDGNPVNNISDIRRPTLVMKDGVIYYPPELHRELGIAPAR